MTETISSYQNKSALQKALGVEVKYEKDPAMLLPDCISHFIILYAWQGVLLNVKVK